MKREAKQVPAKPVDAPVAQQPQTKQKAPGIVQKAVSLSIAAARWVKAGRPVRKKEKILELYSICSPCPHFIPGGAAGVGSCGICGCGTNAEGQLVNKLAWATEEECPATPPKWTDPLPRFPAIIERPTAEQLTTNPLEKSPADDASPPTKP